MCLASMCLVRSVVRLEVCPQSKHRQRKPPSPSDSFCIFDFIIAEIQSKIKITLVQLQFISMISLLMFPQSVNVWAYFVTVGTAHTLMLNMFGLHMLLYVILAVIGFVGAVGAAPNLSTLFIHPFVDFAIRIF